MEKPPKEKRSWRMSSNGGFIFGVVLGFAVCLPITLFNAELLAESVNSLLTGFVIVIVVVGGLSGLAYLFRDKILKKMLGNVSTSSQAIVDATSRAVEQWPENRAAAASSASEAVRQGIALVAWFFARRAMITVVIGLMGTIITLTGATLLLKQTTALELQNKKLDRQIEIMAGQGQWELFWELHYSVDPTARINAAKQLISHGHRLSGIELSGNLRNEPVFYHLTEKLRLQGGGYDPNDLIVPVPARMRAAFNAAANFSRLPDELARYIDKASLSGVHVSFSERENLDLDGFSFRRSLVGLDHKGRDKGEMRSTIPVQRSVFEQSEVHLEMDGARFVDTSFHDSMIRSGFGRLVFEGVNFDGTVLSLTWGQDFIADAHGYTVVVEYHGSASSAPSENDPPAGFGRCSLENVAFLFRADDIPNRLPGSPDTIEEFLEHTISDQCQINRIYFVEEKATARLDQKAHLVMIEHATDRAMRWNESRSKISRP